MTALPPPTASGVRVGGDHYQWLVAWVQCVRMHHDTQRSVGNSIIEVELEANEGGNLDDVVVRRQAPPHSYLQVKYGVDTRELVNEDYLLAPSRRGGPSILAKIAAGWRALTCDGAPVDLALYTNRAADPADALLSALDARTQLLMERAGQGGPSSVKGKARARWAEQLELEPDMLLELLRVLRFDVARDLALVRELASLQMQVAGLRADSEAVEAGVAWVGRQVRDSHTTITPEAFAAAVEALGLAAAGPPRTSVSIATLAPDPLAAECDVALDWVSRFEGDDAFLKRRPAPPASWAMLQADIEGIPAALAIGTDAVALRGNLRQATGFMVGAAMRDVTADGREITLVQRGQLWSTAQPYSTPTAPAVSTRSVGLGDELAVVVAVATAGPAIDDVESFLRRDQVPVAELLVCEPADGARDTAVPDAQAAVALAVGVRDTVRRAARGRPRVHLFLIGPLGLAVLLGHRWNAVAPTVVYEDVRGVIGYEPTFRIAA